MFLIKKKRGGGRFRDFSFFGGGGALSRNPIGTLD